MQVLPDPGVGPIFGLGTESVFHWIPINVTGNGLEIIFFVNENPVDGTLNKATLSLVTLVDCLGIPVLKIAESLEYLLVNDRFIFLDVIYPNE